MRKLIMIMIMMSMNMSMMIGRRMSLLLMRMLYKMSKVFMMKRKMDNLHLVGHHMRLISEKVTVTTRLPSCHVEKCSINKISTIFNTTGSLCDRSFLNFVTGVLIAWSALSSDTA